MLLGFGIGIFGVLSLFWFVVQVITWHEHISSTYEMGEYTTSSYRMVKHLLLSQKHTMTVEELVKLKNVFDKYDLIIYRDNTFLASNLISYIMIKLTIKNIYRRNYKQVAEYITNRSVNNGE